MRFKIGTAPCLAIAVVATLAPWTSLRAHACGDLLGRRGLAAFGLSPSLPQLPSASSLAEPPAESSNAQEQSGDNSRHSSIVGMWVVGFYHSEDKWDTGIEQFSPDGNEMTNDNAFPPAQGNICWGVWQRIANGLYKMKHIGWVWDANGVYMGRFDFAATITLNQRGDRFTGTYVADQEDASGNIIAELHDVGTLRGTRFTVD